MKDCKCTYCKDGNGCDCSHCQTLFEPGGEVSSTDLQTKKFDMGWFVWDAEVTEYDTANHDNIFGPFESEREGIHFVRSMFKNEGE